LTRFSNRDNQLYKEALLNPVLYNKAPGLFLSLP
jgi:hypothetical protein